MLEFIGILMIAGACTLFVQYQPKTDANRMLCAMMAVMGLVSLLAGQGNLFFYRSTEYFGIGDGILLYIACPPGISLSHSPDSPLAGPASGVRAVETGETCGLTERLTGFQGGRILKNKKPEPCGPV